MVNTNCLEGIKCPKCGEETAFLIECEATAMVTDDGAELVGGCEWDDQHKICCTNSSCEHSGNIAEFKGGTGAELTPFSVLLCYADYMQESRKEPETYFAHVMAVEASGAIVAAQEEAITHNKMLSSNGPDFIPLLILRGHHQGL